MISPIKISPFVSRVANQPFNPLDPQYSLKWAVDTDNMMEVGTTTTLIDYFGNNNLSNPLATNQPLTVANVLNGKSVLRFTTDDILVKDVANWFASDTSGQITIVVKSNSTLLKGLFGSCDFASTRIWDLRKESTTNRISHLHNVGNTQSGSIIGTSNLGTTEFKIITVCSNGSAHKLFINSATETISSNTLTGGIWLADLPTQRDNISLGGLKFNGLFSYGEADIYGAYYGAYSTDAAIVQLHNELKQILAL